jgi:hypothetical protein
MTAKTHNGCDILAVWNDVDATHEAEYHRWYWQQHLPERLSVPGFMSAYRYQAVAGSPRFFTWYFVSDVEVLRSQRYLERLSNPTEWTQRVMPWFRNMTRCACRLTADLGRGIGGIVVVVRIGGAADGERAKLASLVQESVSQLFESAGETSITRAQVWQTDREISVQRTPEQALRGGPDRLIDCAVVLHCPSVELARSTTRQLGEIWPAQLATVALDGPHVYALLHSLSVVG